MKTELIKNDERKILENMIQLYLSDLSVYFPIEFKSSTGLYDYDSLDKYFDDSNNYAYFIKNDEDIAGFTFVDSNDQEMIIQEMFILNNYKNKGLGKASVFNILDMFKGKWTIKSLPNSEPAERFWDRTIKEYTNNNYNIEHVGKYNRTVFTFNNSDL